MVDRRRERRALWARTPGRATPPDSSAESAVGKLGRVVIKVPGRDRAGEVSVNIRGGTEAFMAYSDEEIPAGTEVLVITARGGRGVDVARINL